MHKKLLKVFFINLYFVFYVIKKKNLMNSGVNNLVLFLNLSKNICFFFLKTFLSNNNWHCFSSLFRINNAACLNNSDSFLLGYGGASSIILGSKNSRNFIYGCLLFSKDYLVYFVNSATIFLTNFLNFFQWSKKYLICLK